MTLRQYSLLPVSLLVLFCSSSIAVDDLQEKAEISNNVAHLKYEAFKPLNIAELEETKGKTGPLIAGALGAAGGATLSIAADINANQPINWNNAGIDAGAGFVTGATGNFLGGLSGGVAAIALGASTYGGLSAAFGGGGGCNSSCHGL